MSERGLFGPKDHSHAFPLIPDNKAQLDRMEASLNRARARAAVIQILVSVLVMAEMVRWLW